MNAFGQSTRDVAIIGFGPVGAAMALALARYGLTVTIIERTGAPYGLPRAVQIDDEVMRLFRVLGVDEAILADTHINPGTKFVAPDGEVLIDWSRPAEETLLGWNASYRFHQPALEATLREKIAESPWIETRLMADAVQMGMDDAGVTIALAGAETIHARWAIGCDGAGSLTRDRIGAAWEDLGFRERWLVLDLIVDDDAPDYGRHSLQICDPEQPATFVCGVGRRRRFEFRIGDQEEEEAKKSAWRRLAPWFTRDHAKIERAAVYEFRSCIASIWRKGRVLLAGDAAHLTPPFMGQGLCAGFRDVANLSWKLAAVAQGADEDLLDAYQSERAAHVREYIDMAIAMGRFINQTGAEALAGRAVGDEGAAKLGMIRPALGSGLGARDAVAGRLAPHPRLANGKRIEDVAAGRFAVLARPGHESASKEVLIADIALAPWLDEIGAEAVLLRPDGYVLATSERAADLADLAPRLTVAI